MSDFAFNIAKGRVIELYNRVKSNDPANSALIALAINANGDTDATMRDRETLSALLGGLSNEVTNPNYARLVLTNVELAALPSPDHANDRFDIDLPDLLFALIGAGDAWTDLIICYDPDTTSGDDSTLIPLTCNDFPITPDGSNILAQINPAGYYRAS